MKKINSPEIIEDGEVGLLSGGISRNGLNSIVSGEKDDTESRIQFTGAADLAKTITGMLSSDYKERFKAEYQQTKIRYERLKSFNNRIEAALYTARPDCKNVEMPKHDCPFDLLGEQQSAMGQYLRTLEIRAVIEEIDLQ